MSMSAKMAAKIAAAKKVGPDMNEAVSGGGTYTPPAEGHPRLRLVGYYELGEHTEQTGEYAGKKKEEVDLVFELSGKLWEPEDVNGTIIPKRMTLNLNRSLNEKAKFFKLFKVMNEAHGNQATTMVELLGKEFLGTIKHTKGKRDPKKTFANLDNIRKAEGMDAEGETFPLKVDPPLTELKMFVWDIADIDDWNSIFIDGEYPERKDEAGVVTHKAKSKNVIQDKILASNKFDTLPVAALIRAGVSAEDQQSMDDALGGEDAPDAADVDDTPPVDTSEAAANLDDCV